MSAVDEDFGLPLKVESKIYVRTEAIWHISYTELIKLVVHARMGMLIIVLFALKDTQLGLSIHTRSVRHWWLLSP